MFCWKRTAAATAKSLQLCPTLCDPIDGSLPGSPIPGILQARTLEWVAIAFSRKPTELNVSVESRFNQIYEKASPIYRGLVHGGEHRMELLDILFQWCACEAENVSKVSGTLTKGERLKFRTQQEEWSMANIQILSKICCKELNSHFQLSKSLICIW